MTTDTQSRLSIGDVELGLVATGATATVAELTGGRPTLLVLVRHSSCIFCEDHLALLAAESDRIGRIIVVSFEDTNVVAPRQLVHPPTWVWARATDREMYRLLDMQQATGWHAFRPRVMLAIPRTLLQGKRLMRRHADVRQLGGDVIVDGAGDVQWLHRSSSPDDRPSATEILTHMDAIHVHGVPGSQQAA